MSLPCETNDLGQGRRASQANQFFSTGVKSLNGIKAIVCKKYNAVKHYLDAIIYKRIFNNQMIYLAMNACNRKMGSMEIAWVCIFPAVVGMIRKNIVQGLPWHIAQYKKKEQETGKNPFYQ